MNRRLFKNIKLIITVLSLTLAVGVFGFRDDLLSIFASDIEYNTDSNSNNISDWIEPFTYDQDDTNHIVTITALEYKTTSIDINIFSKAILDVGGSQVEYSVKIDTNSASSGYQLSSLFTDSKITSFNSHDFDSSDVTSMKSMFRSCGSLTKVILGSNFTCESCTDFEAMFQECFYLTEVDLKSLKETNNSVNMNYMFIWCKRLITIDLSNFKPKGISSLYNTFSGCNALETLKFSNELDTSKVTTMYHTFCDCYKLKEIDLSKFTGENLQDDGALSGMFSGCQTLTTIDLSNFKPSNKLDASNMFNGCTNLTKITFNKDNELKLNNAKCMFNKCPNLTTIENLNKINTVYVTSMLQMFFECSSLETLDLSNFTGESVTTIQSMFSGCTNLIQIDLSNFKPDNNVNTSYLCNGCSALTEVKFANVTVKSSNMAAMFQSCEKLTTIINLEKINTENVTDMGHMFYDCQALTSLDVSNFNTSKVTNMRSMFNYCMALTSLDVSHFDTSEVLDMGYMFYCCMGLQSLTLNKIDTSNFNTSKVTNMSYMFFGCQALTSLSVSNFDTSNVTDMSSMFDYCMALTSLSVSNFNTSKVTNMSYMFSSCAALKKLNLSSFDVKNVIDFSAMFAGCSNLEEINFSDNFVTSGGKNFISMFAQCTKLKSLDISKFDFTNAEILYGMFYQTGDESMTTLDLSSLNITQNAYTALSYDGTESGLTYDNKNITTIKFGENLTTFGKCATVSVKTVGGETVYEYIDADDPTPIKLFYVTLEDGEEKIETNIIIPKDMGDTYLNLITSYSWSDDNRTIKVYEDSISDANLVYPAPDPAPDPDPDPDPEPDPEPDPTPTPSTKKRKKNETTTEEITTDETKENEKDESSKTYIQGYDYDGKKYFKPESNLTRAELCTIISRLSDAFNTDTNYFNEYKNLYENFGDLDVNEWYKNYVAFAISKGYMIGDNLGNFNPNGYLTRGELTAVLARFKNIDIESTLKHNKNITLIDIENNAWYKDYALALNSLGIVKGYDDNTFKGENSITRAEVVTLINSILNIDLTKQKENDYLDISESDWYFKDVIAGTMD